jgi:hypothetical protein
MLSNVFIFPKKNIESSKMFFLLEIKKKFKITRITQETCVKVAMVLLLVY